MAYPYAREGADVAITALPEEASDAAVTQEAIGRRCIVFTGDLRDAGFCDRILEGPVWTPLNPADTGLDPEEVAMFGRKGSSERIDRPGQPKEIAPAFVFLASNADASFVNGSMIVITGGPV